MRDTLLPTAHEYFDLVAAPGGGLGWCMEGRGGYEVEYTDFQEGVGREGEPRRLSKAGRTSRIGLFGLKGAGPRVFSSSVAAKRLVLLGAGIPK